MGLSKMFKKADKPPDAAITLKFFATLSGHTPENEYPIKSGLLVKELLNNLDVPLKDVHLIFINNKQATLSTPLKDKDKVGIFPAVGGG